MLKLNLVVIYCKDVELSRIFYESLGLFFVAEQHQSGPIHYSTVIGDTVVELYPSNKTTNVRLGLCSINFDNIVLKLKNFIITSTNERAILCDPDENKIELTRL